jgi:hypothetical protein
MALSDCPKCMETPCCCGYEYQFWSTERVREMCDLLTGLLKRREGGEKRRFHEWNKPRCGKREFETGRMCGMGAGHEGKCYFLPTYSGRSSVP